MSRLDELLELRAKIDGEIARERGFLARVDEIKQHAASQLILDRDAWVERVIASVADAYQVPPTELLGRRRTNELSLARHTAAWVLRQRGLSFPEIGKILGRDHTTALHSVRRVDEDPDLRNLARGLGREAVVA